MNLRMPRAPVAVWLYLGAMGVVAALTQIPSRVNWSLSWSGILLYAVLFGCLVCGSNIARWLLIVLGIFLAIGGLGVQTAPLDPVSVIVGFAALIATGILFFPPVRNYTRVRHRSAVGSE
jgi:hypothetical protein